jgi:hypothetical protein
VNAAESISRLRACWVIHGVSGLLVQATYSTLRVPIETKNSTYNLWGAKNPVTAWDHRGLQADLVLTPHTDDAEKLRG